ncbi:MAG: enoyl-CoA hydratase/isomerase family protein, partial [Parvularculaceae bacterium]|nr:enoyl-CoA hydratase/isomerase family protein [Parvularculaceae bacterium]
MGEASDFGEFLAQADSGPATWRDWRKPLAIVDLGAAPARPEGRPACPVIGVGAPAGPIPDSVDVVVEPPATLEGLATSILAQPHAATVVVGVLRAIQALGASEALVLESLAYAALQGSEAHRAWLAARAPASAVAAPGVVALSRDGDALDILLDRPEAHNAIDRAMRDALSEAFELAALDASIRTVRLHANGKAFSIGADLGEFGTTRDPAVAHIIRMQTLSARRLVEIGAKLEVHVDGACIGAGLEMAAFANRITASRRAWFQLPELAMGIMPGAGGCLSVTRRIGRRRAALMILSGERL